MLLADGTARNASVPIVPDAQPGTQSNGTNHSINRAAVLPRMPLTRVRSVPGEIG